MSYRLHIEKISLDDFASIMKDFYQIPSNLPLQANIDDVINKAKQSGAKDMATLQKLIKSKEKALAFGRKFGIEEGLVILLRRVMSSYINKARKLEDYPRLSLELIEKLNSMNLKDTKSLYEYLESNDQNRVMEIFAVSEDELVYIKSLVEVTRLRYVSPVFATVLVESGFKSVGDLAKSEPDVIYRRIIQCNEELHLYKGNIGRKDALFLHEDARLFIKINGD